MSQPTFAVDFGNLNVGWVLFIQGIAPQYALVPYGQPMLDRPASPGNDVAGKALNYRNGFRVPVAGNAIGGVREMAEAIGRADQRNERTALGLRGGARSGDG